MPKPQYQVSLKLPDKTITKKAPSIVEALDKIEPFIIKTRTTVAVAYGKLTAEVNLYPIVLRKLLINNTAKELLQKRMLGMLK